MRRFTQGKRFYISRGMPIQYTHTPKRNLGTAQHNGGMPIVGDDTPSRNEPCRCGSGKKYKGCCGVRETEL